MKKIILGIFVILSACTNKKQTENNESYEKKISDFNIQFERTFQYEYNFGEVDETTKFLIEENVFNKKGKLINQETFHKSEYLKKYDLKKTFVYDSTGNHIKTININNEGVKSLIINKYIKNNNTERLFFSNENKLTGKAVYKYDKNNNLIELISYEKDGKINYKEFYKYNSKNEIIETKTYNEDGEIDEYSIYLKPEQNKTEIQSLDKNRELKSKYTSITNSKNLVTETIYFNDNKETRTVYKYDENDFLIESLEYDNNKEPKLLTKTERIKFTEK